MVERESQTVKAKRAIEIAKRLKKKYPPTNTALTHSNPLQLLLATILSAQCTDEQVNKVTPKLFERFKSAADFAQAEQSEVEKLIHSTGFYKNKAKNLIACCKQLVDLYKGEVPKDLKLLVDLPGVGRKTANVVLGAWWGIPGVVVDTHVKRLSNLLKLTNKQDAVKIEFELMELLPSKEWNQFTMNLILHGRSTCIARRPKCKACFLNDICPSAQI